MKYKTTILKIALHSEGQSAVFQEDGVPADVNLLDVCEYIADCVMAGMARSGSVYDLTMPPELLEIAFRNTVELLKAQVVVVPANDGVKVANGGPAK